jgi:transcriptional regulator with XRE-family HTH domain
MDDKQVNYKALGERLRKRRTGRNLSQETVAEKADISVSFYGHIERGERIPSIETLAKITEYLDLDFNYLLIDNVYLKDKALQAELDYIFSYKSPEQKEYMLNLLKIVSENIEIVMPPKNHEHY